MFDRILSLGSVPDLGTVENSSGSINPESQSGKEPSQAAKIIVCALLFCLIAGGSFALTYFTIDSISSFKSIPPVTAVFVTIFIFIVYLGVLIGGFIILRRVLGIKLIGIILITGLSLHNFNSITNKIEKHRLVQAHESLTNRTSFVEIPNRPYRVSIDHIDSDLFIENSSTIESGFADPTLHSNQIVAACTGDDKVRDYAFFDIPEEFTLSNPPLDDSYAATSIADNYFGGFNVNLETTTINSKNTIVLKPKAYNPPIPSIENSNSLNMDGIPTHSEAQYSNEGVANYDEELLPHPFKLGVNGNLDRYESDSRKLRVLNMSPHKLGDMPYILSGFSGLDAAFKNLNQFTQHGECMEVSGGTGFNKTSEFVSQNSNYKIKTPFSNVYFEAKPDLDLPSKGMLTLKGKAGASSYNCIDCLSNRFGTFSNVSPGEYKIVAESSGKSLIIADNIDVGYSSKLDHKMKFGLNSNLLNSMVDNESIMPYTIGFHNTSNPLSWFEFRFNEKRSQAIIGVIRQEKGYEFNGVEGINPIEFEKINPYFYTFGTRLKFEDLDGNIKDLGPITQNDVIKIKVVGNKLIYLYNNYMIHEHSVESTTGIKAMVRLNDIVPFDYINSSSPVSPIVLSF